ncbi:DUF2314 domain-containing protein [Phenylobacterium terrae]|uniref:DUF2314 domain-containing protein n=1 Tax=Phenylobacterium terrae TaxID=2665495 RepID=A0ABW4N5Z0_9CAUL
MRGTVKATAGLLGAVMLALAAPACSQPQEAFIEVADDDERMNAAMAEAKASLPQFWRRFETGTPEYSDFTVKAAMTTVGGQGIEHIWIDVSDRRDGKVTGRLANEPVHLGDELTLGSEVEVPEAIISDWGYAKGEVNYGHFTTRVLMTRQYPDTPLAEYGLSPNPLESETN